MGARDSTQLAALGALASAATELVSPPVSLLSSSLCVTAVTAADLGGSAEGTGPLAHVVTVVVVVVTATSFATLPTQAAGGESAGPSEVSAARFPWLPVSAEELTSAELSSTQLAKAGALESAGLEEPTTLSDEHSTVGAPSWTVDSTVGFASKKALSGSACLPSMGGASEGASEQDKRMKIVFGVAKSASYEELNKWVNIC